MFQNFDETTALSASRVHRGSLKTARTAMATPEYKRTSAIAR
jgi:hypothetical protein